MATYDLMLLLDTAAPDDRRAKVLSDVENAIRNQGELTADHDWGPRTLSYEIRHKKDAEYHLIQFEGGPTLLEQLNRQLRIDDAVTRFRIYKLKRGYPEAPQVSRERPAAAPAPDVDPAAAAPPPPAEPAPAAPEAS
jgi:small subunit ribosomal protein S6